MNNIDNALHLLGVTKNTLTNAEKEDLDLQGYVIFPGLMDAAWVKAMQNMYEALMLKEGQSAGQEVHQETGTRRLSNLVNKGEIFDGIYTHPKVLAAVYHVLQRDFKLSSLNARDAIPGEGMQALHVDWQRGREASEPFHVVNSIWLVDDFTADNGATRVVPGSHKWAGSPSESMEDPKEKHPDEQLIIALAGTVAVFNSHTWHGGTTNQTKHTRRACHCYYTAREHEQQLNQREYLRKATFDRISPAAHYILDVE